jgi:hypothetical protein
VRHAIGFSGECHIKVNSWLAAQERSWSEVALQKLNIRNAIAVAANDTTDVAVALQQWIRVVRAR